MKKLIIYQLVLCWILIAHGLFAQTSVEFEKISSAQGINQSITYSVQQDTLGQLWVGTEEGVIRFDSKRAFIYNTYHGLPKDAGNRIPVVFIDSDNQIWIGGENNVNLYNPLLDHFERVEVKGNQTPSLVTSFFEDQNHNIWVGAFNGLWTIKTNERILVQKVVNKNVQAIDAQLDQILLGTDKGLEVYYPKSEVIKNIENPALSNVTSFLVEQERLLIGTKNDGLVISDAALDEFSQLKITSLSFPVTSIIFSPWDNHYYIGTDGGGILMMETNLEIINRFEHNEDVATSISSNGIYDLIMGHENILWVATYGGGINFIDPAKSVFLNISHRINDKNSLAHNLTRAIEEDDSGNIWFGTKEGISIWNEPTNKWKQVEGLSNIVLALEYDDGFMWAGTYNDGVYKINIKTLERINYSKKSENPIALNKVYVLYKDSDGNIWIGGIDGNLSAIMVSQEVKVFSINQIKAITETSDGTILAAGRNGVFNVDLKSGNINSIDMLSPRENLKYFTINAIREASDGKILLATNGAGLVIFDRDRNQLNNYNISLGMPSDIIQGVLDHGPNEYWASTTKGLAHISINLNDTIIKVFDEKDGLASTEFNYGSFTKLANGKFAFGGVNGVTLFNPTKVNKQNYLPEIYFESLSLFNDILDPGKGPLPHHLNTVDKIDLKYWENSITIKFTGITHSAPSRVRYSWKLEGFDENWSEPSYTDQMSYTNLDPGQYTLRVKAANREDMWGPERQLMIYVNVPWWATNTAYFFYILFAVAILLAVILLTKFIINKRHAEEQINFFNNITHELKTPLAILLSSLDNLAKGKEESNQKAKNTIKRLNALFEQMLNFQKVTSSNNPLQQITKIKPVAFATDATSNFTPLLQNYNLRIEIIDRWGEGIFYYDKENLNKIIFNLISNAIKYSKSEGIITVKLVKIEAHNLLLEIADQGIGIPADQQKFIMHRYYRARNVINSQKTGTGLGLMMVKNLIEKSGGKIRFESVEDKGTTFYITLKNQASTYHRHSLATDGHTLNLNQHEHTEINEFSDSKILIVEDNDELRSSLSEALGTFFQVFEASNGKEGLDKASEVFPDLILTDLIMPVMDGMAMVEAIKDDINFNHIPIFMFTVLRNPSQEIESLESGIAEYLEKPIDINLLLAKITNMLSWQQKLREKYIHESEVEIAHQYRTKKDANFVMELEAFILDKIEDEALSVHDLCQFVGMSRTSLYMKLKNLIDLSPQDFIIHTKLKRAKQLLQEGEANIKEISYRSGFSNPKYFSTSFKKFYGISPSKYQESLEGSF